MAFWIAVIPAVLAVLLIVGGVNEPHRDARGSSPTSDRPWRDLDLLPAAFWFLVAVGAVLTLARFSEAFLVLRAHDVGFEVAMAPLVMVAMAIVYAVSAYPAGYALDSGHGLALLLGGVLALIGADLLLAAARGPWPVLAGAALWGLHMGLTQGLLAALVAATAPAHLRGTAFGVFNLASGVALLLASVLAGWLWDALGPAYTFYAGAAFTALAGAGLWLKRDAIAALGKRSVVD